MLIMFLLQNLEHGKVLWNSKRGISKFIYLYLYLRLPIFLSVYIAKMFCSDWTQNLKFQCLQEFTKLHLYKWLWNEIFLLYIIVFSFPFRDHGFPQLNIEEVFCLPLSIYHHRILPGFSWEMNWYGV